MNKQFLIGASISGHQVDGGRYDQWTQWEERNAERLARDATHRFGHLQIWKEIEKGATSPANYRSGEGIGHRARFRSDLKLAKDIGLNSVRFSIEWASLEPHEGEWDEEGFAFYAKYFKELESLGLEPVVTLWHWTHPQWFEAKGGFTNRANLAYFERYAKEVLERFGGHIKWLSVLNEPNVYTSFGFLTGEWPPDKRSPRLARRVYWNLAGAHRRVYRLAKKMYPEMMIGSTMLIANIRPKRHNNALDRLAAHWRRLWWNWWWLQQVRWQLDFIGLNYYFTEYMRAFRTDNPKEPLNDMGWYMEPSGLEYALQRAHFHFRRPFIIMETGVADHKDQWRGWWIEETLAAVKRAQARGIDVRGYMHWSLLDNFEWSHGWWPKFGLIAVDHSKKDMPRKVRDSAKFLKN